MTSPDTGVFRPIHVTEVELAEPLPDVRPEPRGNGDGARYERVRSLVLLHGQPLGIVDLELGEDGLSSGQYAAAIDAELADPIGRHLAADGLRVEPLTAAGYRAEEPVPCLRRRAEFLERAPQMAVIIPTRDRPQRVRACVDSILAGDYPADRMEVWVVDNAPSTTATRDVVESSYGGDSRVHYVREDNPGSASARNQGLAMVETEIVAFTDDDVIVDRHWLTELARGYEAHPEATSVNGLLLPAELESQAQVWFEEYGGFSRGFESRAYDLDANRLDEPLYPYAAGIFGTGNNMSFRREALRELGDFDPALGNGTPALGGVDSEVMLRTILRGHTVAYQPSAIAWHLHRADYDGLRRQVYSYGVGLSAYMLKSLAAHPRYILDFLGRLPKGLRFALDPGSEKNAGKLTNYPRELTRIELKGMAYGPLAYVRSRRAFGAQRVRGATRRKGPTPRVDTS